ncbi:MAG: putative head morphosis protein [Tardiphaga sp.]|uniref:hypothetical protein n=1 Tax=Tardiphaga sp. TaxID=1926292 RepID=UPI00263748AB|nr:hypothetical protein [Tardiphaga sp.]MDB5505331.1 putative head morphosis protein [Tardiphaga sp.]
MGKTQGRFYGFGPGDHRFRADCPHCRAAGEGRRRGAIRAIGLDPVQFREFDKAIAEAFEDGGKFSTKRIPVIRQPDGHVLKVQFDVRNSRAEQWLKDHSSKLISQIMDDQRTMVRQALRAGMEAARATVRDAHECSCAARLRQQTLRQRQSAAFIQR